MQTLSLSLYIYIHTHTHTYIIHTFIHMCVCVYIYIYVAPFFAPDFPLRQICTPLAMEQLQSEHLMSWMLGLGKDRLEQLLGRLYDLKKREIIQEMVSMPNLLHPHTLNKGTWFSPACPCLPQTAI